MFLAVQLSLGGCRRQWVIMRKGRMTKNSWWMFWEASLPCHPDAFVVRICFPKWDIVGDFCKGCGGNSHEP